MDGYLSNRSAAQFTSLSVSITPPLLLFHGPQALGRLREYYFGATILRIGHRLLASGIFLSKRYVGRGTKRKALAHVLSRCKLG